jgi:hypothetical protein
MRRLRSLAAAPPLLLALAACDGRAPPGAATAAALLAPAHGSVEVLEMRRLHAEYWVVRFRAEGSEARAGLRHADGGWRIDDALSNSERLRFL